MPQICWYFQLHQPWRLADYDVFKIGQDEANYFIDEQEINRQIFVKVANKSYRPMLDLLAKLVAKQPKFVFALSVSGIFLEQAKLFAPDLITKLQLLARTGQVEFLAETYFHSLAGLFSPTEFKQQVELHQQALWDLFQVKPQVFRNTELIYSDKIAKQVAKMGFLGILTEGVERHLHGRPRTQIYRANIDQELLVLLKHSQLSDDIAFRFSNKSWSQYPVTADKFLGWLRAYGAKEIINLFLDFETFGEHQWADTGIFDFFEHLVLKSLAQADNKYVTPTQIFAEAVTKKTAHRLPIYQVDQPISWADIDRDLTAWLGNELQQDAIRVLYELEPKIKASADPVLLSHWRRLQTSDHFYYMCVKWSADGDVHAYFSPYESPFAAYNRYSAVLADLISRLQLVTG